MIDPSRTVFYLYCFLLKTTLNEYIPHSRPLTYMKKKLVELKEKTDKSRMIVGVYNTPFSTSR